MKKFWTFILLALCMLMGTTGYASSTVERSDFYGTWYFTSYVLEGEHGTAVEIGHHLQIVIKDKEYEGFYETYPDPKHPDLKAYVSTTYTKPVADYLDGDEVGNETEYDIPLDFYSHSKYIEGLDDFHQGTYFMMLRSHPRTSGCDYKLFLRDKETMVMGVRHPQDGGHAYYEYTFKRTDPFKK